MSRARVLLTAVCILALTSLTLSPAMAFEAIELDPSMLLVHVETQNIEQTRSDGEDGSFVVGGHLGAKPGCPGVQAFVKKVLADGSVAWALSASADKDCDLDGQPDGGGAPMFASNTDLDPDYILASTVYDTVYLPDGTTYVTGQHLIGWLDSGELTAAWAAFVLYLTPEGEHIADLYVGPRPTGPPAQVASCDALCSALGDNNWAQWGGRALAPVENEVNSSIDGIILAGWRRAADDQGNGRNIFLVALTTDLTAAKWFRLLRYPGADQPLDAVVADNGDVYVTGYYGPDHDVFVACFDGQVGTLTHLFLGGGPQDDWGETITITTNGEIEVRGKFTDTATFEDQTLEGEGLTDFRALLTPTLELILIEALGSEENGNGSTASTAQTPIPDPNQMGTPTAPLKDIVELPPQSPWPPLPRPLNNGPSDVQVLVGTANSTNPSLVTTSNNQYLVLFGEQRPDHKKVEVVFEIPILPGASVLKSVKLELKSNYCTNLKVLIGGGDATPDTFYEIGDTAICPLDEPIITIEIPTDIAEQHLGFSASGLQSSLPLKVLLDMEIHGASSCPICVAPPDDVSNDEVAIESEFP